MAQFTEKELQLICKIIEPAMVDVAGEDYQAAASVIKKVRAQLVSIETTRRYKAASRRNNPVPLDEPRS